MAIKVEKIRKYCLFLPFKTSLFYKSFENIANKILKLLMTKKYTALNWPELGLYAQLFLQQAAQLKNRSERQTAIEKIIDTQLEIAQVSPKLREETRLKIWVQVLACFDNGLDIDVPENLPLKIDFDENQRISYPPKQRTYRDYGRYFNQFVDRICKMPVEERPEGLKNLLAYMQLVHQNIHREEISPKQMKADLYQLTAGRIDIEIDDLLKSSNSTPVQSNNKHPNFQKKPKSFRK